ncbi:MAG TPA: bifunctional riboflavin kinase/FAD synthetase [Candidatus Omnitrophota bacterium]|nr:bifunctional riboflavin kinase/FAD synthetase [Candidatus Omnitrophota bacterium]HPS20302.1 bifunctional riboflavin kinase/FAD synthetase [Candidatus Omnitrophota bacterium]
MKVFYGYKNVCQLKDPALAIGIFDGVHIGHKKIISKLIRCPGPGRDHVVMTFDPHPRSVLIPAKPLPRIMSLEHRLLILERLGVDVAVVVSFTEHIANMSPEDFVRQVISHIGARTVFVGSNFRFGSSKQGGIADLADIGEKYGITLKAVQPVRSRGKIVSSTWIRSLIAHGNLNEAAKLLRRPVSVLGTVVGGDERGRTLGFPTANIDPHQEVIPPPGVYAVKVCVHGKIHDGILNIGFNPTFYGPRQHRREEPSIEVNIFDFHGNLYGSRIEIFFLRYLRKERRFRDQRDLVSAIQKDIILARVILGDKRSLARINKYMLG